MDSLKTLLIFLPVATLVAAGCSNPDAVPAHTAADEKAIAYEKSLTPQQQIDQVQNGSMPPPAKAVQIQKIKEKYHLP